MTCTSRQSESSFTFFAIKYSSCIESLRINTVPGVIQLESNGGDAGMSSPRLMAFCRPSLASWAVRKRRDRCWFILARGATPSIARKNTFRGRILEKRCSMYAKMPRKISSSAIRNVASPSFGCEQLWMMPFMSRYKLSNSGIRFYSTNCMMSGYRSESHRKYFGTPIVRSRREAVGGRPPAHIGHVAHIGPPPSLPRVGGACCFVVSDRLEGVNAALVTWACRIEEPRACMVALSREAACGGSFSWAQSAALLAC